MRLLSFALEFEQQIGEDCLVNNIVSGVAALQNDIKLNSLLTEQAGPFFHEIRRPKTVIAVINHLPFLSHMGSRHSSPAKASMLETR